MPPNPPQQPDKMGTARFFKRVSSADPLAGSATNGNPYAPAGGSRFDFMLNNKQVKGRGFGLLHFSQPRNLLIAVIALVVLVIIGSSFLGGHGSIPTKDLEAIASRQQELIRVSGVAQPLLQQPQTVNLNATVTAAVTSEQAQLINYMKNQGVTVPTKTLAIDLNQTIDSQLNTARQANSADQTYTSYLKQQLASYQSLINAAYPKAGTNGKALLKDSYDSTTVLLSSL